jgi:hypothetical protein
MQEDPIGFAGTNVNLYRFVDNEPVNGTDPTGLLRVEPITSPQEPIVGDNEMPPNTVIIDWATWDFTLNKAKDTAGYFVQHVSLYVERQNCPCHIAPEGLAPRKVAEYWEAFYVPANKTRIPGRNPADPQKIRMPGTDRFQLSGAKDGTCGEMLMIGEVRYFPATNYFDPEHGIGFAWDPWSYLRAGGGWWPGIKPPFTPVTYPFDDGTGPGMSPGDLPSTGVRPTWWDTAYDKGEGTGKHSFDYRWSWCAPEEGAHPVLNLEETTSESNGCDESRK